MQIQSEVCQLGARDGPNARTSCDEENTSTDSHTYLQGSEGLANEHPSLCVQCGKAQAMNKHIENDFKMLSTVGPPQVVNDGRNITISSAPTLLGNSLQNSLRSVVIIQSKPATYQASQHQFQEPE